ncbi:hypothetical protein [Pseudoduganella lutea]|uniref:Uncharacterized protein n=1 Tax=Pseudoduganella lutea TaxID=321985 RepID=A0A4P6KSL8_9BURK|nr:hypothetical protein [Pseudoduganella lutea]QBE61860.1 hypothetical protein EWM63_01660 [Pseudoduganella lutea]
MMKKSPRADVLTRQHIEVALVFQKMVGSEEALHYLKKHGVPIETARRVLFSPTDRRGPKVAANGPVTYTSVPAQVLSSTLRQQS